LAYVLFKFFMGTIDTIGLIQDPYAIIMTLVEGNLSLLAVAIVLLLIASFITPLAIVNFAKKDSFAAGFSIKEILGKISGTYIGIWLLAVVYSLILTRVLGFIPLVGTGIAAFIVLVTTNTWYAEAYSQA